MVFPADSCFLASVPPSHNFWEGGIKGGWVSNYIKPVPSRDVGLMVSCLTDQETVQEMQNGWLYCALRDFTMTASGTYAWIVSSR